MPAAAHRQEKMVSGQAANSPYPADDEFCPGGLDHYQPTNAVVRRIQFETVRVWLRELIRPDRDRLGAVNGRLAARFERM